MGKIPMTGALNMRGGTHPALNSVIGRNAVLVKGVGAVCAGRTPADVEAVAMIVSKNCTAACYVRKAAPLGLIDARLQRISYLTSYSRLFLHADLDAAIFPFNGTLDFSAQKLARQLHAIADSQHRDPEFINSWITVRCIRIADAGWAARKNNATWMAPGEFIRRKIPWNHF